MQWFAGIQNILLLGFLVQTQLTVVSQYSAKLLALLQFVSSSVQMQMI